MPTTSPVRDSDLVVFDYVWSRFRDRLGGISDAECGWEPTTGVLAVRQAPDGRFRADPQLWEADPQPMSTIAWRLCHIIENLSAERCSTWLGLPWDPRFDTERTGDPSSAADLLTSLDDSYAFWRGNIAKLDDAALWQPMGPIAGDFGVESKQAFVLHALDEIIHHTAEVGMMRDFYRATAGSH
jgi:DinB family protein